MLHLMASESTAGKGQGGVCVFARRREKKGDAEVEG